jgi:hypothetical protein
MFVSHFLPEAYDNDSQRALVANENEPTVDWTTISSNVIATVLGAAVITVVGAIFFTAYQVPRQQDVILRNQEAMKETMVGLGQRLDRIETNDRRQDERIIQGMRR